MHPYRKSAISTADIIILFGWIIFLAGIIVSIVATFRVDTYVVISFEALGFGLILVALGHIVRLMAIGQAGPVVFSAHETKGDDPIPPAATAPKFPENTGQEAQVLALHALIQMEKDKISPGRVEEINDLIAQLVPQKDSFSALNDFYTRQYRVPLIKHLISITSNYTLMYRYLEHLINIGVCRKDYPHELIS